MSPLVPDNRTHADPFDALFREAEKTDQYWISKAKLRFTEEMLAQMDIQGVSKTALANRLAVKPAQISRLCSGENNFTLDTMVRIARALNCEVHTHLQSATVTTQWIDFLKDEPAPSGVAWAEEHGEFTAITTQQLEQKASNVVESAA